MTDNAASLMTDAEFDEFFEPYAKNVEGFYAAKYWDFSDELVKHHVRTNLSVTAGAAVLDAGGGTGRWANWLADELGVSVTVADKSTAMLSQAKSVAESRDDGLVSLLRADLERPGSLGSEVFDGAISTYGVWSFVNDPVAAFCTVYESLKPGGVFLAMCHGYMNALESKLSSGTASVEELVRLRDTGIVKWAEHVPSLRAFSAASFADTAERAGFSCERVYGVGVVVHPGPEDFGYPYVTDSQVSARLQDPEFFEAALATEKLLAHQPEYADRGTNLLMALRKPM